MAIKFPQYDCREDRGASAMWDSTAGEIVELDYLDEEIPATADISWLQELGPQTGDVGLASESDSALQLSASALAGAGLSSESDSAISVTGSLLLDAGLAVEADSALQLSQTVVSQAGLAQESDSALQLSMSVVSDAGLAQETDSAFELLAGATTTADVAWLQESQPLSVGLASETDAAFALSSSVSGAAADISWLQEVGWAPAGTTAQISWLQEVGVGRPTRVMGSWSPAILSRWLVLQSDAPQLSILASESDSALQLSATVAGDVGLASEIDRAFFPAWFNDAGVDIGAAAEPTVVAVEAYIEAITIYADNNTIVVPVAAAVSVPMEAAEGEPQGGPAISVLLDNQELKVQG